MNEVNKEIQDCIKLLDEKSKESERQHNLLMMELDAAIEKAKSTSIQLRKLLRS